MANFTILQWNINGFINNINELQLLIKEHSPSLISIQETHCKYNFNPIPPKGYSAYFYNSPVNTTSKQGIGVLIKNNIPHKQILINSELQTVVIEIQLNIKFTIISFYIPPCKSFSKQELKKIFDSITTPKIVIGDFNSWNVAWGSQSNNHRGNILESAIMSSDLCILNDGRPTHLSTHGTLTHVDVSLCSPTLLQRTSWDILDEMYSSDHFPIVITLSLQNNTKRSNFNRKFLLSLADWPKYSSKVDEELQKRPQSSNINREASLFTKAIRNAANVSIPQSSNKKKTNVPWWNKELSILRNNKINAWQKFKSSPTTSNLILYKKENALFRREMKKHKKISYENFTSSINKNSSVSDIWSKIRRLSNNNVNKQILAIENNNQIITDPSLIADSFANKWSEYSFDSNFSPEYNQSKTMSLNIQPNKRTNVNALYIEKDISIAELMFCLAKVKGSTPGFDRVSYKMIKEISIQSKKRLLLLYNNILNTSVIPTDWKTATVIPIPKTSKNSIEMKSYRPISLLPCPSKILEKIVATRLYWFSEKNCLISRNQVAFKAGRGCTDALLHIDFYITKALSSRNHVSILSIDFEKAFDRIGAHVILNLLNKWKVGPKIFNYVKSYLKNRQFRVRINGIYSSTYPLHNGIPQGSPLSVILFTIAFSEISQIINNCKHLDHCIYADDLYIFCKKNSNMECNNILQDALNKLNDWSLKSGAKISIDKTKKLHICRKQLCDIQSFGMTVNNTNIENVNQLKILGILFTNNYSWNKHFLSLKKSLIKRANIISFLSSKKSFIHINTLVYITKTLVLSKIDYGFFLTGNAPKSTIKLIQGLYHQTIRSSIHAFRTTPVKHILAESGLPTLEERIHEAKSKLIPKITYTNNSVIDDDVHKLSTAKRIPRITSAIGESLDIAKSLNIHQINKPTKLIYPPWFFSKDLCDISLSKFIKQNTSNDIFIQLYLDKEQDLLKNGWNLFFTDGSKMSNGVTSYAIVDINGKILRMKILPEFTSIFAAEALAIINAIHIALDKQLKTAVCTDSLSVVQAILNPLSRRWETVNRIRDVLIKHSDTLKILWIPGHTNIKGNDNADEAAKFACKAAIIMESIPEKIDIQNYIKHYIHEKKILSWSEYYHPHYKELNMDCLAPQYPTNVSRQQIQTFCRLRMGHTYATHSYRIRKETTPPPCSECGLTISIKHILLECTQYQNARSAIFGTINPITLLKDPTYENIIKIHKFIIQTGIII